MEEPISTPLPDELRELMRTDPVDGLRSRLDEAEPRELADAFFHFTTPEQLYLLRVMDPLNVADLLPHLSEPTLENLLDDIADEDLALLFTEMEPDDAVYLISLLKSSRLSGLMDRLGTAERQLFTKLLTYGEETAGRIMDPDVVRVKADQSVGDALADIREYVKSVELDEFFSIFVVDEQGVLVGAVPNYRMLLAQPEQIIGELMEPDVVSVEANMDQEAVSAVVRDHDLVTVPVVDHAGRLVGRVTVDDVVDVINEEHEEDLGYIVGAHTETVAGSSVLRSIRDRSPWLLVAMLGEFVSALIMREQQTVLIAVPQLAFFIPVVMAMGGNSGVQSAVLTIRGLATGDVGPGRLWRRLMRELGISLGIGLLFAVVLTVGSSLLTENWRLGMTVGIATSAGMVGAALVGTGLPMLLKRIGLDPALATGPFLTTFNDTVGILTYLAIAFLIFFW